MKKGGKLLDVSSLPDLLIVLTGGKLAYTREDGVKIIPLGCLKD
jgi:hypothetical protein